MNFRNIFFTRGLLDFSRLCLVALFGFAATAAHAYDWKTFDGTGEWPTSGDVFIPKGTTVYVDDAHVDAVAGWENVYLENTLSKLVFTNATKQAVYNAADTCNNGVIRAENCCGLTINSTNPNKKFTGGSYEFDNSVVTVTTDDGLCPGSKARLTYPASNSVGDLRFHKPAWDEAGWTGTKAITNRCNIFVSCAAKSGSVRAYIGSLAADEYFVQDANFYFVPGGANKYQGIRNNYEQISGDFGTCSETFTPNYMTGQHAWYAPTEGAQVRFMGTAAFKNNAPDQMLGTLILGKKSDWYFGMSGGCHMNSMAQNTSVLHALIDNALNDTADSTVPTPPDKYVLLSPYPQEQKTTAATNAWNLHGHTLTVAGISASQTVSETTKGFCIFESAEPATLTLAEGWYTYYGSGSSTRIKTRGRSFLGAPYFVGAISVDAANAATNSFATKLSAPTGTLTVRNDTTVLFKWDGGWDGSAVVIESSGFIDAQSEKSFSGGHSALTINAGGKLKLYDGSPVFFATAVIGGTTLDKGSYTVAQLRDEKGMGAYFAGDDTAVLNVVGTPSKWKGWIPGEPAEVPTDMTVAITDADVENVQQVLSIDLGVNSVVDCSALTKPLVISAPVSGSGQFRIVDCGNPVVLSGNNAGIVSPGCFYIENSCVCVSNRYGLGSAKTARTTIKSKLESRRVHFGLADAAAFTNEVPLLFDVVYGSTVSRIGTGEAGKSLVQAADVQLAHVGVTNSVAYTLVCYGDVTFLGDISVLEWKSSRSIRFYGMTENDVRSHVTFGEEVDFSVVGDSNPYTFWLVGSNHPGGVNVPLFTFKCAKRQPMIGTVQFNVPDVEIDSDVIFGSPETTASALFYYVDVSAGSLYLNTLHLAGHDVPFCKFSAQRDGEVQHAPASYYADVESPTAAYLVYAKGDQNRYEKLRFRGQAGFHFMGLGTNLLEACESDTTGDLKISSGVSGLVRGATWAGSATVDGGLLYIDSESAAAGAFGAESSATVLSVSKIGGGKVFLEDGKTVVLNAYYGGSSLPGRSTYCANDNAEAIAAGAKGVDWIAGSGTLYVLKTAASGGITVIFR